MTQTEEGYFEAQVGVLDKFPRSKRLWLLDVHCLLFVWGLRESGIATDMHANSGFCRLDRARRARSSL